MHCKICRSEALGIWQHKDSVAMLHCLTCGIKQGLVVFPTDSLRRYKLEDFVLPTGSRTPYLIPSTKLRAREYSSQTVKHPTLNALPAPTYELSNMQKVSWNDLHLPKVGARASEPAINGLFRWVRAWKPALLNCSLINGCGKCCKCRIKTAYYNYMQLSDDKKISW